MLSKQEILRNATELASLSNNRTSKYTINLRYYLNSPYASLKSIRNPQQVGYDTYDITMEDDTSINPSINVIKSIIDTLVCKISQSKVRPFFNVVNGSFKDIQTAKNAQHFFDQWIEQEEINKKVTMAFRDAAIFDHGVIYIDDYKKCITRVLPWQVFIRPSELTYNNITRAYYRQEDYPVTALPDDIKQLIKKKKINVDYVTYHNYYDVVNQTKAHWINECEDVLIEKYEGNRIPFIFLWYTNPINTASSLSICDMLKGIQQEINILMSKIKDASQLNPAMTFFVPDDSNVKQTQLNNRIGNIISYRATSDMSGSPVTVATPPFIDGQYMQLLNDLVQKAYELVGVSQLSAQARKPAGVDSGIALQTLEDVESDRFEEQLNQVIKCYVDIAKTTLKVFPKDDTIMPEDMMTVPIKWKDIVEASKRMKIQFSAADSLSKDPSTKLQQLQSLAQAGVIPKERIPQFLEIPDLEGGYSIANNAINAVLSLVSECIEDEDFDYNIPSYIPLQMLTQEILNTQLSLRAANYAENRKAIEKLDRLYEAAVNKSDQTAGLMQEQANQINTNINIDSQSSTPDLDRSTQQPGVTGWNGQAYKQTENGGQVDTSNI